MKLLTIAALTSLAWTAVATAQGPPPGRPARPPKTPREAAPVDLTGYWVSVISEDWRWRMVTPLRGDFQSIPLNEAGKRVGLAWDPAADEAAGLQCQSYGAPAVMRVPGRVHITWTDDRTLKLETDAGGQTRLLHFNAPPAANEPPSRQGYSVANWERPVHGQLPAEGIPIFSGSTGQHGRSLEVATTHLLPGYLRKNGPPYSEHTKLQEYFDYHKEPNGDEWFTVTTLVTDPTYLDGPFLTSSDFKKEPSGKGWDPMPCTAR